MKKMKLIWIAALAILGAGTATGAVVTTDQYKFLFNGVMTSTIPSAPAITSTLYASTSTSGNLFATANGGAALNASSNVLFSGGGSGNRGSYMYNLNNNTALSTTKKEVLEFDWNPATTDADAMSYNALGISDLNKNPVMVLVAEAWGGAAGGIHLMNLTPSATYLSATNFQLPTVTYGGTSNYKGDCATFYAGSALGADFVNNKTYHIRAKLDFSTHVIDTITVTRADDATKIYTGTNIAFLSNAATNVDKVSAFGARGKSQTNGTGANSMVWMTVDNYQVYTWESVSNTANVIVNYYDADSPATLVTSVTRANQIVDATYSASGLDKASFSFGGNYCVYSSMIADNVTVTSNGLAHVDIAVKRYPVYSGVYTWTGITDGTWNELVGNFTDGTNALGYQPGNGILFPESASNKTITVNDNISFGANDITISGDGYVLGGTGTLSGTGKINVNLSGSQGVTLSLTNNMTGRSQISGGVVTVSKAGTLGTAADVTGATTLVPSVALPNTTFTASSQINPTAASSIAGITAGSGVKVTVTSAIATANAVSAFLITPTGTLGGELELNGAHATETRFGLTAASTSYLSNAKVSLKGTAFLYIDVNHTASTINVGTLSGEAATRIGWGRSSATDRNITWSVGGLNENSEYAGTITNIGGYNASGSFWTGNFTNFAKVGTGVLTFSGAATTHNGTVAVSGGGELKVTGSLGKSTNAFSISGGSKLSAHKGGSIIASTLTMAGTDTLLVGDSATVTLNTGAGTTITNVVIEVNADTVGILNLPAGVIAGDTLIVREAVACTLPSASFKIVNAADVAGMTFNNVRLPIGYTYNQSTGVLTYLNPITGVKPIVSSFKAYSVNRNLTVSGVDSYEVYNVQGSKVASVAVNNANTKIALQSGIYIVKAAGKVQKVLVK